MDSSSVISMNNVTTKNESCFRQIASSMARLNIRFIKNRFSSIINESNDDYDREECGMETLSEMRVKARPVKIKVQ